MGRSRIAILALVAGVLVCAGLASAQAIKDEKSIALPAAVESAVMANFPKAEIDKLAVEEEAGIALYDIEFKSNAGEIEVAEDGTVMDLARIVNLKSVPPAAVEAIRQADPAARIIRMEKSEIRAEVRTGGGHGQIIVLSTPRYVYEAELAKGEQRGEIQVTSNGKVVEDLKWAAQGGEEKEKKEK